MIMFMIQAVIVLFAPITLTAPIWSQILALNLLVSGVLGWFLYKQRYHTDFSYDETGFRLRKGSGAYVDHKWNEFHQVSLARDETGDFRVRLYGNEEPFEIPVSKLKLDPFQFRLNIMNLVEMSHVSG
jgi:hypothetical protein